MKLMLISFLPIASLPHRAVFTAQSSLGQKQFMFACADYPNDLGQVSP